MTPPVPATHAGPAWLLVGPRAEPGVLALHAGRLRLTTADGVVFDEPVGRVGAVFGHRPGTGGAIDVDGIRRRLAFTRPRGAELPGPDLLDLAGVDRFDLLTAAGSLDDVAAGRRRARTWRTLLDPR